MLIYAPDVMFNNTQQILTANSGKDIKILSYLAPGVYNPNFVPRS